jgi:hypothetical protein
MHWLHCGSGSSFLPYQIRIRNTDLNNDWFILFSDKVFADSIWNLDPVPYLCIINFFLFRWKVREQSQAKSAVEFTQL